MKLQAVIDQFLQERLASRYSPLTIRDYKVTFKKLQEFMGEVEFEAITRDRLLSFMASQTQISATTLRNHHADLSALFQWALKEGLCNENPMKTIQAPKPEKKVVVPFTRNEIQAILEAAGQSLYPLRDRAIILLLLDTGIRASELTEMKIKDLNRRTSHIVVFGKGRKERYIPISEGTFEKIEEYLSTRKDTRPNAPLFALKCEKKIDRVKLRRILAELGNKAGVNRVYPHRFRHTFAIQFLRNGGNIYTLQHILGHTTLGMVKRYLAIAQVDMDRDHELASPVRCWNLV